MASDGTGVGITSSARIVIEGDEKFRLGEDFMALVRKIFISKLIHSPVARIPVLIAIYSERPPIIREII